MIDAVLERDTGRPCEQQGEHAGPCEGPVDEVLDSEGAPYVEFLCRAHQRVYGQGHYATESSGWPHGKGRSTLGERIDP